MAPSFPGLDSTCLGSGKGEAFESILRGQKEYSMEIRVFSLRYTFLRS